MMLLPRKVKKRKRLIGRSVVHGQHSGVGGVPVHFWGNRHQVEQLIIRMASEDRDWGYDRIAGATANLGYVICDQTVGNTNAAFMANLAFCEKRGYQGYRRGTIVPGSTIVFIRKSLRDTTSCQSIHSY
jgi:hypothetical protein